MSEDHSHLHTIQQEPEYQLLIRDQSDRAAQGLLTLLVTINVGAFVTVIELLEDHHWLLILFTLSTVAALLARTGVYYIYRNEVTMFEHPSDLEILKKLDGARHKWWTFTERTAWLSLLSFVLGVILLTGFFIADYY